MDKEFKYNFLTDKPLEISEGINESKFGHEEIPLKEVTYIEGTSFIQNLLMYFSGMGGMIGNKLFMGKVLILDATNQKFAVL
jgi:hypothetical protein